MEIQLKNFRLMFEKSHQFFMNPYYFPLVHHI